MYSVDKKFFYPELPVKDKPLTMGLDMIKSNYPGAENTFWYNPLNPASSNLFSTFKPTKGVLSAVLTNNVFPRARFPIAGLKTILFYFILFIINIII